MASELRYRLKTVSLVCQPAPTDTAGDPSSAAAILRAIFATLPEDQEHLVMLALDAKNRVRGFDVCHTGDALHSIVSPALIFRRALMLGAVGIVIAHNHPSGDPTPSPDDRATTERLKKGGELVGIEVRDHVVIGSPGRAWSFHREGAIAA